MPHLYANGIATYFEDSGPHPLALPVRPAYRQAGSGRSLSNHERRTNLWPKPALC